MEAVVGAGAAALALLLLRLATTPEDYSWSTAGALAAAFGVTGFSGAYVRRRRVADARRSEVPRE